MKVNPRSQVKKDITMNKTELSNEILDVFDSMPEDRRQQFIGRMKERGGKFRLLAQCLTGEKSLDDPEWDQYRLGNEGE